MLLCSSCFNVLKDKGYDVQKEDKIFLEYEEAEEMGKTCDFCEEIDALYSCCIGNDLFNSYNILREIKETKNK
jgi:hypothetical protein